MLVKSGLEVWLVDKNGKTIEHGNPYSPIGTGLSEISAEVTIEAGKMFEMHWRMARGSEAISAWNEVFMIDASKRKRKAAVSWMDKFKPATQIRSSDRLEAEFSSGLKAPNSAGTVRLEVSQAKDYITTKCIGGFDEVNIDLINGPTQNSPPWLAFNFIFKPIAPRGKKRNRDHIWSPQVNLHNNAAEPARPMTRQRAQKNPPPLPPDVSPGSDSSTESDQSVDEQAARSKRHKQNFPTPVSRHATEQVEDDVAILRKKTEAAETELEKKKVLETRKAITRELEKQVAIEKERRQVQAEVEAEYQRAAELQKQIKN